MPIDNPDKSRRATDQELEDMEKKLREIYSKAEKDLEKKVNDYFRKFEHDDKIKRQMVTDGELSKTDYIRWRQGKIFVGKRWNDMKEQMAMSVHNANIIANDYINGRLPDVYTTVYNIRAEEIGAEVPQISFTLADPRTVRNLSLDDGSSFLPYKELGPDDIPWNMRKINSGVLQGILQGESMPQIAQRLIKVCNNNEVAAMRTARTVVNTVENQARWQSASDAQDMGCIMYKMWESAHDNRVRHAHEQADSDYNGEDLAIPMDEPFLVDGEKLMFPGDLAGSPKNIYNCRCVMPTKVVGFKSMLPEHLQSAIKARIVEDDE